MVVHVFSDNRSGAMIPPVGFREDRRTSSPNRGIKYRLEEHSGEPTEEILNHATEHDVGLICLAGRKRSPTGKVLFGGVTHDAILNTDHPVTESGCGRHWRHGDSCGRRDRDFLGPLSSSDRQRRGRVDGRHD
ncbi:universal stress protein [Halomicrococcus sp. NG-SE-24]|uniref:universal stress protein n=1 Tax=Halomicrococcus sp. NG-SE-24 TaxID=3436928 RepID=UPI003D957D15